MIVKKYTEVYLQADNPQNGQNSQNLRIFLEISPKIFLSGQNKNCQF